MRLAPSPEAVDPFDVVELGDRAAMGLHGENRGLAWTQRVPVITGRRRGRLTWRIHYGDDGMASRMTWPAYDVEGMW